MTKKHFRITLYNGANALCEKMVSLAAKANGGEPYTLAAIKTVADGNIIEYPNLNEGCAVELIGNRILHVDRKIGADYKTVLVIEEIEINEPEMPQEYEGVGALAE